MKEEQLEILKTKLRIEIGQQGRNLKVMAYVQKNGEKRQKN